MRFRAPVAACLLSVLAVSAGCSGGGSGAVESSTAAARQTTVGTRTVLSTVTSVLTTSVISQQATTVVTTPTDPTLIPPPATTAEPAATAGECPYLTNQQIADANGQRIGRTATIAVEPYPICIFYRPDGTVMAVTRIVVADSPEAAAAAVNQHVPVANSFPVAKPQGWVGGAMGDLADGVPGYPDARSIYAVSKGATAIIAISNQKQSIKGRQMVTDIVASLGL